MKHEREISSSALSDEEPFGWQPVRPWDNNQASWRQQQHSQNRWDVVLSAGSDQITAGGRKNKEAQTGQSDLVSHASSQSPATEGATQRRRTKRKEAGDQPAGVCNLRTRVFICV